MARKFASKAATAAEVVVDEPNIKGEDTESTVEEAVEETVAVDEVSINPDIVQKPALKLVRICPSQNHSCVIGGTRYFFTKDVCQNVPQDVKDILNKSGLLKPL